MKLTREQWERLIDAVFAKRGASVEEVIDRAEDLMAEWKMLINRLASINRTFNVIAEGVSDEG